MADRQRIVVIRTKLETDRILERVGRLIPRGGATTRLAASLVGGSVEGKTFTLTWDDGEGERFQAIGLVREGPSERLVRLRFEPLPPALWQRVLGFVLLAVAFADMSWPVRLVGAAVAIVIWTATTLRPGRVDPAFVAGLTEQLVDDLEGAVLGPGSPGQHPVGGSRASAQHRLDLTPSGRNQGTMLYLFQYFYLWCWPVPLVLIGASHSSVELMIGGFILVGLSLFLLIRSTLDAWATASVIHRRCGLFGLATEDIPISRIDEILVDAWSVLPRMGTLIVRCGFRRLTFEGVLDPEGVAAHLLALREKARTTRPRRG